MITLRRRMGVIALALALWGTGIEARLIYLQVVVYDDLVARAERQQNRTIKAPAKPVTELTAADIDLMAGWRRAPSLARACGK